MIAVWHPSIFLLHSQSEPLLMSKIRYQTRKNENLLYVIVWVLALALFVMHELDDRTPHNDSLQGWQFALRCVRVVLPFAVLFAVHNYVLLPLLYFRRRIGSYLIACLMLVVLVALYRSSGFYPNMPHPVFVHPDGWVPPRPRLPMPVIHYSLYAVLMIGCNLAVSLTVRQIDYSMEREQLLAANMESRLEHLKSQINPHFYMNMLNNIHGLIDVDAAKAQDMVVDMSRLMRYMLYDSSRQFITLSKEVDFLRDYLRVMRQRYPDNKVTLNVSLPSEEEVASVSVPPLLFLVFIENAFKHGISYRQDSYVAISLNVDEGLITFSCINSCHTDAESMKTERVGIGLENVRQRLRLIYGEQARLSITNRQDTYTVNLIIPVHETQNTPDR